MKSLKLASVIVGLTLFSAVASASNAGCKMPLSEGEYAGVITEAIKGFESAGTYKKYVFEGIAPNGRDVTGCIDTETSVQHNFNISTELESIYSSNGLLRFLVNKDGRIYEIIRSHDKD